MRPWAVVGVFALVPALVLGAAYGASYEPPNPKADGPPPPTTTELVQAATRGCVEALGVAEVGVHDGVVLLRCKPNLGTGVRR